MMGAKARQFRPVHGVLPYSRPSTRPHLRQHRPYHGRRKPRIGERRVALLGDPEPERRPPRRRF